MLFSKNGHRDRGNSEAFLKNLKLFAVALDISVLLPMREETDRADGPRTPSLPCVTNKSGTGGCYHMKFCHWPFFNA